MDTLKKLYKIHAPSGRENGMRKYIKRHLRKVKNISIVSDYIGNMYITKGKAETYPCVVAHLDQVEFNRSKDFQCVETDDIIFGYSPSLRAFQGIGGDDKNGIWVALKCLEKYDVLKVAFFVEEENGCVGSSQCNLGFFEDVRFVLQCDRLGYNNLITSIYNKIASDDFLADTSYWKFGYKTTRGMLTDVAVLSESVNVSMLNISCGYYNPHTDEEFTCKKDLMNCLSFVENVIENCTKVYPHVSATTTFNQWYKEEEWVYENPPSFYDV